MKVASPNYFLHAAAGRPSPFTFHFSPFTNLSSAQVSPFTFHYLSFAQVSLFTISKISREKQL